MSPEAYGFRWPTSSLILFFGEILQSIGRLELRSAFVGAADRGNAVQGLRLALGRVRRSRRQASIANTKNMSRSVGEIDEK